MYFGVTCKLLAGVKLYFRWHAKLQIILEGTKNDMEGLTYD
jgi:hypothetical protein